MPTQRTYQCIYNKVHTPLVLFNARAQAIHCTPDCGSNSTAKQSNIIVDRHSIPFQTRPYAHALLIVTTAQTTVYFTRVYHREEKVWLQFHTICCKYLLSPFVLCFHLGSRICLRGRKSTLKSMGSSKNGRLYEAVERKLGHVTLATNRTKVLHSMYGL